MWIELRSAKCLVEIIQHPKTEHRNQESGIGNQESGIRNQESGIGNQESGIRNVVLVTLTFYSDRNKSA